MSFASPTSNGKDKYASQDSVSVQVVVRCRPLLKKELTEQRGNCIDVSKKQIEITKCLDLGPNPSQEEIAAAKKSFTFDGCYGTETDQKTFYEESCAPLVEAAFEGFNGTIFAYGQTGCGKTFTMQGPPNPPEMRGVIPASFDHVFENIRLSEGVEYLVRCSYLEIYNEEIRDLLSPESGKCELKEDPNRGVYVKGLSDVVVENEDMLNLMMNKGLESRTTGATLMNEGSSRSHSIFTMVIEMNTPDDGKDHFKTGKLNLVDLAGSERQNKTGATGERLKEGCKINLSLSALGNVISALVDGRGKHIPYRDSKLTRLLQDSLGGNTKTLMIAAISPADYNYDETLSTLRYANRAKNIKNKPKVNEDPKDTMLREYKSEIDRLKDLLMRSQSEGAAGNISSNNNTTTTTTPPPTTTVPPSPSSVVVAVVANEHSNHADSKKQKSKVVVERVMVEKEIFREKIVVVEVEKKVDSLKAAALDDYNRALVDQQASLGAELSAERERAVLALASSASIAEQLQRLQARVVGSEIEATRGSKSAGFRKDDDQQNEAKLLHRQRREKREKKHRLREEAERTRLELSNEERFEAEERLEVAKSSAEEGKTKADRRRKRFERKLLSAQQEIEDLTSEFQIERDGHLAALRESNREAQLWRQVAETLLSAKDVARVWQRSTYDEESEQWGLPESLIFLRPKFSKQATTTERQQIKFPSLETPAPLSRPGSSSATSGNRSSQQRPPVVSDEGGVGFRGEGEDYHRRRSLENNVATERSTTNRPGSAGRHKRDKRQREQQQQRPPKTTTAADPQITGTTIGHGGLLMLSDTTKKQQQQHQPEGDEPSWPAAESSKPPRTQERRLKSRGGSRRNGGGEGGGRPQSRGGLENMGSSMALPDRDGMMMFAPQS